MVECLVESSVECQVGSSSNTHPTSNPLHKGVSEYLGWVLTKLLFILYKMKINSASDTLCPSLLLTLPPET